MLLKERCFLTLCYCSVVWTEIASVFANFSTQHNVKEFLYNGIEFGSNWKVPLRRHMEVLWIVFIENLSKLKD